jgi:hypothetical protein
MHEMLRPLVLWPDAKGLARGGESEKKEEGDL